MVIIQELKDSSIDTSVTKAVYNEGPFHFDEWYALVQKKYPNATEIDCCDNQLTELNCPNAAEIYCYNNQLTEFNCPNATVIYCYNNQLTKLNCPNATIIYCLNNPNLKIINAPKLKKLRYDNNIDTIIPIELDNPIIYNKNYNELNYNEIVEQVTRLKQKYTKSAMKV